VVLKLDDSHNDDLAHVSPSLFFFYKKYNANIMPTIGSGKLPTNIGLMQGIVRKDKHSQK
jgi:hypothetical protein